MADFTWTGGVDGVLATAGNWSPSGPPGNTDRAFFPDSVTNPPSTTMDGLADTLALIHVASGATYNIGSSGNELKVKCDKVVNYGRGGFWYDVDGNTVDANIIFAPGEGGSSNLLLSTGGLGAQVYCLAGKVSITGVGATELIVVGRIGDREAEVTIVSGVGTTTNLDQYAGSCFSENLIARLELCAGLHEKLTSAAATTVVQSGGTMRYDATDTVLRYEGNAGTCDFARAGKALTVTTFVESPNLNLITSEDLTTFTNHIRIAGVK